MPAYIRGPNAITVVLDDGETLTIANSNPRFREATEALQQKDINTLRNIANPASIVERAIERRPATATRARIDGGVVYYGDRALDANNALGVRMLAMVQEGFEIDPMLRFLDNLMENPSYRAVNELYRFMEKSNLAITEDGHFLAYKRVRDNYKDIYSGKMDNSVGAIVEVPRNMVDEDSKRTCSHGLHVCSREYLPHYGTGPGSTTIMVKVNPRDVVAIPTDYNDAKLRCCRYEVLADLTHQREQPLEGLVKMDKEIAQHKDVMEIIKIIVDLVGNVNSNDITEETTLDQIGITSSSALTILATQIVDYFNVPSLDLYANDTIAEIAQKVALEVPVQKEINVDTDNVDINSLVEKYPSLVEYCLDIIGYDLNEIHMLDDMDLDDIIQQVSELSKCTIAAYDEEGALCGLYETVKDAQEDTGANESSIRKVLRGQRQTAGGYRWFHVDPTLNISTHI